MIEANTPDGIAAALEALKARPDSRPLLPDITCDTTIVHGTEDTIISREDADAMHAGIEGSQLVVLPRSGHLSNLESPLEFTRLLNAA
jgi:pimeloyl-ACP methyl ester carboxylesterase